ncbi:unnamed protein product [Scytosiphon promiscuus]
MTNLEGFTGDYQSFPDHHRDGGEAFEAAYPACVYVPLSRLNVDTEGVSNGTITSLSASFLVSGQRCESARAKGEGARVGRIHLPVYLHSQLPMAARSLPRV